MKWLGMIIVMVVSAICVTVAFWVASRTERAHMTDRPGLPALPALPATLSVLVDQQGRLLELRSQEQPLQVDPAPSSWQDLEPRYEIVAARWINDDEHGQIQLLQLQLRVKEQ